MNPGILLETVELLAREILDNSSLFTTNKIQLANELAKKTISMCELINDGGFFSKKTKDTDDNKDIFYYYEADPSQGYNHALPHSGVSDVAINVMGNWVNIAYQKNGRIELPIWLPPHSPVEVRFKLKNGEADVSDF
jgi:hypothetical protein